MLVKLPTIYTPLGSAFYLFEFICIKLQSWAESVTFKISSSRIPSSDQWYRRGAQGTEEMLQYIREMLQLVVQVLSPTCWASLSMSTMFGCESWTIKKAEHKRVDAFELWCWRRFLGVPWTARKSNQSILKEINPEYSSERRMLELRLRRFGHLMQRGNPLREDPDVEKDWKQKEKGAEEIVW